MKKNISLLILVAMLITIHPVSFANVQMIDKTISSEDKIFNSEYIPSSEVRIVENSVDVNFIIKPNDISLFSNEKGLFDCGSDYAYRDFAIRSNAEKKQAVYNKLLEVCKAFSTDNQDVPETEDGYIIKELPLLEYNLSVDDVSEVYFMFRQDHPEFYWLSYSITTSYKLSWDTLDYVVSDLYIEIFSDYANGNERSKLNRSIMQSVEKYAGIANKYSSEFEKVLSLHDAIIDDVDYDSSSGSAGHNIVGILDGESNSGTMCEGYAKTYQLVLNYLDIDNVYISGTGNNVGHAWNAVKMEDGKYYCVDLTWDDQPKLPNGRIYDFFLTSNAVNPSRTPHSPNGTGTDFQYSLPSISHNDYVPGYIKCDSIDYLKYSIKDDGTIFITDCDKGAYGVFEIPSEIDSMMVTGIGPMVFQNCRLLRKVIVPKGIVDIYFYAFMHCVNISEIQLPDSVEFIGNSAFKECTALSQITIPENVTNIPPNAFADCSNIKNVKIPDTVVSIGEYAFGGCDSLTDVYYIGDKNQWDLIEIENGNEYLINAKIHYSNEGEVKKSLNVEVRDSSTNSLIPTASLYVFYSKSSAKTYQLSSGKITLNNVSFPLYIMYASASGYDGSAIMQNIQYPSSGKIVITLNKKPSQTVQVKGVTISGAKDKMKVGETQKLTAKISPTNAADKSVTWSSSNSSVASVSGGTVKAVGAGTATVTAAASNGKSASVRITVSSDGKISYSDYEYKFPNVAESFGYPIRYKIPAERYLQAGYSKAVARSLTRNWTGNCFGMSTSSVLFYKNILKEEHYASTANVPNDFDAPNSNTASETKLRNMIELLMVSQYNYKFKGGDVYNRELNANDIKAIAQELQSGNPVVVMLESIIGGHAVVFSGYKKTGDNYYFDIYDCSGFVTKLTYNTASRDYEFTYSNSKYKWKPTCYATYADIKTQYTNIRDNDVNGAASLLSVGDEQTYTYIICPAKDVTITNEAGKAITVKDGGISGEIDDVSILMSEYLAENPYYTIIAPTGEYTITGSGDTDEKVTIADDHMSVDVTAKASAPVTVSSNLHDISIASEQNAPYEMTYTTYDNIFDKITLSGTAAGEINASLTGADVILSGVKSIDADATRSDNAAAASADAISGEAATVECAEQSNGTATLQIKTDNEDLTEAVALPERKQVSSPEYDLPGGEYIEGQTLTFTKDDDTIIYYTTDGSDPTADNGIIYTMPVAIDKSMTVKAVGTKYGYTDSEIVSLEYNLPDVTIPVPSILDGEYEGEQQVELFADEGADIYYTTDGSDPSENGILYEFPIILSEDTTLRAYAVNSGCASDNVEYKYAITPSEAPADPDASPTVNPTTTPAVTPTTSPTAMPTETPTESPTVAPVMSPTAPPTAYPTASPSASPTGMPEEGSTATPTTAPTTIPTSTPTGTPSVNPTAEPQLETPVNINDVQMAGRTVNIDITKLVDYNAKLIVTSYTHDGQLIGVALADIDQSGTFNLILNVDGADYISAFAWNSLSDMIPVSNKFNKDL